jgi:hypothetical protein
MSVVEDMAALIVNFCNDEGVREQVGSRLVVHGMYLNYDMLLVLTPTCSTLERDEILSALPTWAQRQIQRSVDEANAMTDRVVAISRGRRPRA